MQYDTYGVVQNVSSGNPPGLGCGYPLAFILSRYIHGTHLPSKGCGLVGKSLEEIEEFIREIRQTLPFLWKIFRSSSRASNPH